MRMGDQSLLAERPSGQLVESSRLSRGTAEQLYLSMRLGLIQAMPHANGMPLPDVRSDFGEGQVNGNELETF